MDEWVDRQLRKSSRVPPLFRRSKRLKVSLRPWELADLRAIAEAWGVPTSIVAWAAVQDFVARCRRKLPEYDAPGGFGLAAAVEARMLPDLARAAAAACPRCSDTPKARE